MGSKWTEIGIGQPLADALEAAGIKEPTAVQSEAIAALLAGADVTARSQTGSGKTLAFLLPMLEQLDSASSAVQAVVLAPTQELAMQITRVAQAYGEAVGIRVVSLIGGAAMSRQVENLKKHKPQLVVGTPGRIHELAAGRKLKLSSVTKVVIDEADQVFNLGSVREVDVILKGTSRERQVAFFSATRPEEMAGMERKWMREPKLVDVSGTQRVAESIKHHFIVVDKRDKVDVARRLVRLINPSAALLFLNDTENIAQWESKLRYEGFSVEMLYGDANKQRRSVTLDRFRSGSCKLLLATDVAARGLDIEGLPLVINLDPPIDADHYVHRAGRTGRMGKPGVVISIITYQERFIMDKFSKRLGIDLTERVMMRGKLCTPEEARQFGASGENRRTGGSQDREPRARISGDRPVRGGSDMEAKGTRGKEERAKTASTSASASFEAKPVPMERPAAMRKEKAVAAAKPAKSKPPLSKKQQLKEKKDKGAPKWLKAKRSENNSENKIE
ncbi:DEAD/DEAH box helicase domain protein [Paenibacillus curdlanolyticus YK9]|uniref:DEAD/DEAH box helicase domain protein n=1 Tax=Paenibacillus curdlanolyticus YK9 TaxID=717606 RepID=E0I6B9_9BACL|nr:DEAD/DEAH box helicase [Paenibacillus curdlanolyticus]EFM11585.1 DEAD/DEAH box helicase domain protein [Paenibacillus curdlanolyticus YK9]